MRAGADYFRTVLGPRSRQFFELADIAADTRRGKNTAAISPIALEAVKRLEAYVLSADRLHGDDTRVPVLAKGKTDTGRNLGLREGRQAVWRARAAGGGVLLLARPGRQASPGAPGQLHRDLPG